MTEHIGIAIKLTLPQPKGDYHGRCGSSDVVLSAQQPTRQRTHPDTEKEVVGNHQALGADHVVAGPGGDSVQRDIAKNIGLG